MFAKSKEQHITPPISYRRMVDDILIVYLGGIEMWQQCKQLIQEMNLNMHLDAVASGDSVD